MGLFNTPKLVIPDAPVDGEYTRSADGKVIYCGDWECNMQRVVQDMRGGRNNITYWLPTLTASRGDLSQSSGKGMSTSEMTPGQAKAHGEMYGGNGFGKGQPTTVGPSLQESTLTAQMGNRLLG